MRADTCLGISSICIKQHACRYLIPQKTKGKKHSVFEPPSLIHTPLAFRDGLSMRVHLHGAAAVPGGESAAAVAAVVDDVLEAVHEEGDAAEADADAETEGPGAVGERTRLVGVLAREGGEAGDLGMQETVGKCEVCGKWKHRGLWAAVPQEVAIHYAESRSPGFSHNTDARVIREI